MLIIEVKDSIDKALRQYKRKYNRVGVVKELRRRKQFTKPSVEKRHTRLKAIYKEQKMGAF